MYQSQFLSSDTFQLTAHYTQSFLRLRTLHTGWKTLWNIQSTNLPLNKESDLFNHSYISVFYSKCRSMCVKFFNRIKWFLLWQFLYQWIHFLQNKKQRYNNELICVKVTHFPVHFVPKLKTILRQVSALYTDVYLWILESLGLVR